MPPSALPEARVDLHCHTTASFDGVAAPGAVVERAAAIGITHLASTDHDTIEGALRAAEAVDRTGIGIRVIVGSEVLTSEGDLILLFLRAAIPTGLSAREAIEAGREQGALIGLPHPYDRSRRSILRDPANMPLAELVDWIETRNARVPMRAVDDEAAGLAHRLKKPGVGVSDAHTLLEVGAATTRLRGNLDTPAGLLAALEAGAEIESTLEPEHPRRSPADLVRALARHAPAPRSRS